AVRTGAGRAAGARRRAGNTREGIGFAPVGVRGARRRTPARTGDRGARGARLDRLGQRSRRCGALALRAACQSCANAHRAAGRTPAARAQRSSPAILGAQRDLRRPSPGRPLMGIPGRPPPTTFEYIEANALREPRRLALVQDDQSWTYEALYLDIARVVRVLHALGVKRGDRVAVGTEGLQAGLVLIIAAENL